ncbi:peptidase S28 [Trichoderma chlorosporum]
MRSSTSIAELLMLAGTASALLNRVEMRPGKPQAEHASLSTGGANPQHAFFDQLIDHDHPELGTFKQRYAWNGQFYKGPGSPIILVGPNESALDGYEDYTTNVTLPGVAAQELGAGALIIEHRYWGQSSPFDTLTTENMRYLTLEQSIKDLTYFAENVVLPFDLNHTSSASKAPWVLVGCSYSGALTAWVQDLAPGTFWAYSCSSPVVEAVGPLWRYFSQVKLAMPQNCTSDYSQVIQHVDQVLLGNNEKAKQQLKTQFGLGDLEHDDDFATALNNALYTWQSQLFSDPSEPLQQMCDYVENQWPGSNAPAAGAKGVGLTKALTGLAKWFNEVSLPGSCLGYGYWTNPNDTSCYNSYNQSSPIYTDLSVNNTADRQWNWFLCNEPFKWWQVSGPDNLVSSLVNDAYFERQCEYYFPREGQYSYGIAEGATTNQVNQRTGGWFNINTHRLQWTAGEFDPWRPATVVAQNRPGGPLQSTAQHPVHIVPGAAHCGDVLLRNANANEGVRQVFDAEVANIKQWVGEWYTEKGQQPHY